jgi:hypothetical protein
MAAQGEDPRQRGRLLTELAIQLNARGLRLEVAEREIAELKRDAAEKDRKLSESQRQHADLCLEVCMSWRCMVPASHSA